MPADVKDMTAFALFAHVDLLAEVVALADHQAHCFACWQTHTNAVNLCSLAEMYVVSPMQSTFCECLCYSCVNRMLCQPAMCFAGELHCMVVLAGVAHFSPRLTSCLCACRYLQPSLAVLP